MGSISYLFNRDNGLTENAVADDQYHEIISASDAWVIADDDRHDYTHGHVSRDTDLKATSSARRVKALVEQVTGASLLNHTSHINSICSLTADRYSPLPSFRQRTQFLIHVQLPILEVYHSRISSSLDAFETLSSALVRAVPGALGVDGPKTDGRKLTGIEGSQRLCKALLSAKYIENAMRTWGEEVVSMSTVFLVVSPNKRCLVFPGTLGRDQPSRVSPCGGGIAYLSP